MNKNTTGFNTEKEAPSYSPVARGIIQGLREALAYANGEGIKMRATFMKLPDPAPSYDKEDVRRARKKLGMTQRTFASFMNVSVKSVENWEAGTRTPGPPARRLLQIASDTEALKAFAAAAGFVLVAQEKAPASPSSSQSAGKP